MTDNFNNNLNPDMDIKEDKKEEIPQQMPQPNNTEASQQQQYCDTTQQPNSAGDAHREGPSTAYYNPYSNPNNRQNPPYGNYYSAPNNGVYQQTTPPIKNKKVKKGTLAAVIIICSVLIIASGYLGFKILTLDPNGVDSTTNPVSVTGDGTQLQFSETPSQENTSSGDTLTAKDVYKKVNDSSVGVLVYTSNSNEVYSEGTGVVMGLNDKKDATYVITCAHVVKAKNPKIVVQTADGKQYDAVIVGIDEKTDIGVIRVESTELKPAEFADSTTIEVGDIVYAIGNPGGMEFFGSFTDGIVSAIGRPIDSPVGYEVACIQHTAPINPGNSGGALVNEYGQVIGINSSKIASEDFEGMGFAVPSATVKYIVDELIKNGYVSNRPVLGIEFTQASQNQVYYGIVRRNGLPSGTIVIETIVSGSDLNNTKAREGDMIIAVNGQELDTTDVLLDVIEKGKVGDTLTLTIARANSNYDVTTFDVTVKLVEDGTISD